MKRCAASILVMVLIVSGVFEFQSRTVSAQQVSLSFDGISDPAWGSVSDVSYSPDGRKIAVATDTGVYIYDEYLQPEAHLNAHVGQVYSAEWRGDGSRLATGGEDATLRIWDMIETSPTYLEAMQVIEDDGPVYGVSWSPNINANIVATRTVTRREQSSASIMIWADIKIWNLMNEQVERVIGNLASGSNDIVWHPDESQIASAGAYNVSGHRLWVWDIRTGDLIAISDRHIDQITGISWKPDSSVIAFSDRTGIVDLFDVSQGRSINEVWSDHGGVSAVDWDPTGHYVAVASYFGAFLIYDANTGLTVSKIATDSSSVSDLEWANTGHEVAVVLDYDTVRIYDVSNLPENTDVPTITPITPFPTDTLAATPTPTVPTVPAATTTTTTLLHEIQLDVAVYDAAWSPDGSLLAVATESGIRIFTSSLQFVTELQGHLSAVTAVAWSPDGTQLASGASYFDDGLRIWNYDAVTNTFTFDRVLLRKREVRDEVEVADYYETKALAWSPDGSKLAEVAEAAYMALLGKLTIYETATWSRGNTIDIHNQLNKVEWNPNSDEVAVVGRSSSSIIYLVDVSTMQVDRLDESSLPTNVFEWMQSNYIIADLNEDLTVIEISTKERVSTLNSIVPSSNVSDWNGIKEAIAFTTLEGLQIWHVPTNTEIFSYESNLEPVALDWSSTDLIVFAGSNSLKIIDVNLISVPVGVPTITPYASRTTVSTPTPTTIPAIPTVTPPPSPTPYVMPAATTYTIRAATASPTLTTTTLLHEIQLEGEITAVEWNADGSLLAVASGENVEILDSSLQPVTQFKAHTGQVTALTWNPDGTQLATGGREGNTIKIWDYDAQRNIFNLSRTITTHYSDIVALAWSPDGSKIAEIGAMREFHSQDLVNEVNIRDTSTWLLEFDESVYAFNSMPKIFWNVESTEFAFLEHQGSLWSLSVINALTLSGASKASGYSVIDSLTWRQNKLTIGAVGEIYSRNSQDWTPLSIYVVYPR